MCVHCDSVMSLVTHTGRKSAHEYGFNGCLCRQAGFHAEHRITIVNVERLITVHTFIESRVDFLPFHYASIWEQWFLSNIVCC